MDQYVLACANLRAQRLAVFGLHGRKRHVGDADVPNRQVQPSNPACFYFLAELADNEQVEFMRFIQRNDDLRSPGDYSIEICREISRPSAGCGV